MKTTLLTTLVLSAPLAYSAPFIDDFADSSNLSNFGPSDLSVAGNVLTVTRTSAVGDVGINWFIDQTTYFSLEEGDAQYILEVDPLAAIGNGQWSTFILFFNSSNGFLAESELSAYSSSTSILSENIADFATSESIATPSIADATQYQVRIRLQGTDTSGFQFSEFAAVPEPSQSALIGGVLALAGILLFRRKRS